MTLDVLDALVSVDNTLSLLRVVQSYNFRVP